MNIIKLYKVHEYLRMFIHVSAHLEHAYMLAAGAHSVQFQLQRWCFFPRKWFLETNIPHCIHCVILRFLCCVFQVDQAAAGLLALGLKKGDRLGIWSPNRYEWVLMQFATAQAGIILVRSLLRLSF